MSDLLQMIVYNIRKIICWITICLDQDHIIKFCIIYLNIAVNGIMKGRCSLCRIVLTNNVRNPCVKLCLNFFFGKMQTMLIIFCNFLAIFCFTGCSQLFQTLFRTEAVISLSFFHQLFSIVQVHTCLHTFTLHIWTITTIFVWSFIVLQSGKFHCIINDIQRFRHKTLLIGIFNTKHKRSMFMACDQILIQCGSQITYMHASCWTRCKSCSYLAHSFLPPEFCLSASFSYSAEEECLPHT